MTTQDERGELLSRAVSDFIDPDGVFEKKLQQNPEKITIKFGVDPTRPDIHLGHSVIFRRLRKFQDLGCKVIFLIGDLTAQIGDPSGHSKVRPEIQQSEIETNMKTYLDQVGKILKTDPKVFSWIRNSDWYVSVTDIETGDNFEILLNFGKEERRLTLPKNHILAKAYAWEQSRMQKGAIRTTSLINLLSILKRISFSRLIGRDLFQERIKSGGELFMHEMLYPILQGIDSTALYQIYGTCDLEVGGSDQTFNMLMARDIMKIAGQEAQSVLAFELLEGLDGKEKMSKSLDNYIAITDLPNDMFGKVMSIPDELISRYFELCTYTPISQIEEIRNDLQKGKGNPRDFKLRLAREITEIYHGQKKAKQAENFFKETFGSRSIPKGVNETVVKLGELLGEVLIREKVVNSKTEFKRLVEGKAIEWMEKKTVIDSISFVLEETGTYRVGKKRFLKLIIEN